VKIIKLKLRDDDDNDDNYDDDYNYNSDDDEDENDIKHYYYLRITNVSPTGFISLISSRLNRFLARELLSALSSKNFSCFAVSLSLIRLLQ
jgi:hypothetical protein